MSLCARFSVCIAIVLVLSSFPARALAVDQCPTSNPRGLPYAKTFISNRIPYRINAASFDSLSGISRDAGVTAVVLAADAWNEQTTTADFRYLGSTSLSSLPDTIEACDQLGVDASVVRVSDECLTGGYAQTYGACWRAASGGDAEGWSRFEMIIFTRWRPTANDACEPIPWSVGAAQSGRLDLASVATHEFGHALDVGHIPDEYWGVMSGGAVYGSNRNRDLYLSDIECANVIAGTRGLRPYHRYHVSGNLLTESTFLPAHLSTPQATVGVARNTNGAWSWASAFRIGAFSSYYWNWGLSSLNETFMLNDPGGMGITIGTTHEAPQWARLFWPERDEYPRYDWRATHAVRYKFSDTGFTTSGPTGIVAYCNSMSSWMQCARTRYYYDVSFVHTAKPVSMTWDDVNLRTVFAWVHQDRDYVSTSRNRELKIAFGHIGHIQGAWLLPSADDVGVRSSVSPGVACSAGRAGGYDCILAYVDDADPAGLGTHQALQRETGTVPLRARRRAGVARDDGQRPHGIADRRVVSRRPLLRGGAPHPPRPAAGSFSIVRQHQLDAGHRFLAGAVRHHGADGGQYVDPGQQCAHVSALARIAARAEAACAEPRGPRRRKAERRAA